MAILYRIKNPNKRGPKINDGNCRKKSRKKGSRYFHDFNFSPSAEIYCYENKRDNNRQTQNNKRNSL